MLKDVFVYLHKYVIMCPPWMYMNVPVCTFVRPHAHIYILVRVCLCAQDWWGVTG